MHLCLQIPKILAIILDSLINDGPTHEGRALFHALAVMKTCHAFREPAAKELWKCLYNIVPLIMTMPDDLWELSNTESWQFEPTIPNILASSHDLMTMSGHSIFFLQRFRREVQPSDWTRFDIYGSHVREIGSLKLNSKAQWTAFVILDENVIFELKQRPMPILPNLQHMVALTNHLALAPTFLTPRMQHLKLIMRAREVTQLTRLTIALPVLSPHLRSLELHPSGSWLTDEIKALQLAISALLLQLDLKEFVCMWRNVLTEEMLNAIVRMPSLWKLSITMDLETVHAALQSNPVIDSRISRFSITANTVARALIPKIIVLLNGTAVEAFSISGNWSDELTDLEEVTSTIGKHYSPARLLNLVLLDNNRGLSVTTFASLRPLLPFYSLQSIIVTSHLFSLSDEDVKTLAQSWPLLEVLTLSMSSPSNPKKYGTLTLHGVLWLAKYCRNLKALALDFSCTGSDTETKTEEETVYSIPSESEAAAAANRNTWYLGVGKSTISEARPVASFLQALFPQLAMLSWAGTPDLPSGNSSHWHAVEGIILNGGSPITKLTSR